MKKLLLFVFITTISITSSLAQAQLSPDVTADRLKTFITTKGTPSDVQSFILNGYNLTQQIIIDAPLGFELCTDTTTTYGYHKTIIVIPNIGGFLKETIYVRLASTAPLGLNNGIIYFISNEASYGVSVKKEVKGNINILPVLNNSISTYSTTDFPRGRNTTTGCKTSASDENTIDVFYPFIANNSTSSIDLTVGNPAWLSTLELVDTLTYASIANTCQKNIGVGLSTRTYNFTGLTVGQKYMVRLELGDTAPLGHARMEAVDNTFSLKLNSTVTNISDNTNTSNKTISTIYNLQGLEVSKDFRGLVIYKYSDGTTQKVMQE